MLQFLNPYEQIVAVTILLLKIINVRVTHNAVNGATLNYPDYTSILSISDALHTWHVENVAVSIIPEKLTEPPLPFITFIKRMADLLIAECLQYW